MLSTIAWISLSAAFVCALVIALDEARHPQKMTVMNLVWPVTALYFSVFGLWAYFRVGRRMARDRQPGRRQTQSQDQAGSKGPEQKGAEHSKTPSWEQVAVSASHCGAGCTLGDIVAEFLVFGLGLTLFGASLYADFAVDFAFAWAIGIGLQYFAIQPMQHVPPRQALTAAIKADTLSILFFQIGMYAWMTLVFYVLFPRPHLHPTEPVYWFMMQIAMVLGFVTTLPVNRLLIERGLKEAMG